MVPLLVGMVWALGLTGWILGRVNLMAAGFGAVLLGVGDDVGNDDVRDGDGWGGGGVGRDVARATGAGCVGLGT